MRRIYPFIFTLFLFFSAAAQKQNVEIIWVLPSKGDSILVYYHVNTHFPSLERKIGPSPDHGILYLCPNEVSIDSLNGSMTIEGGKFSLLEIKSKKDLVTSTNDGLSLFRNIAPVEIEDEFDLASFMWILPESASFHDYNCNQEGNFTRHRNTLLFTAKKVNQLEFEIFYKEQPETGPEALAENPEAKSEDPCSVILANPAPDTLFSATIHFDTGKWDLKPGELQSLKQVVEKANNHPQIRILVTGHTDPLPFKEGANSSNWELSARRASAVLERLIEMGIPETQIGASFHSHLQGENRVANIYLLSDATGL